MSFDAFVSYSHAADGQLAPAVQQGMQRLAKPWYRPRALRVFRDDAVLSANPHLWSAIQAALDESEWFVLMASPDAAASEWVERELRHWLETKPANRVLVVLTDGDLHWDEAARQLTGAAVPVPLRDAFDEEPRHVDLRWARTEHDLDLRNARFRDVIAQLAAPAHGVGRDELESEDIRLHRRARRLARGATTVLVLLVVLSLVLGAAAWQQRSAARHQAAGARTQARLAREAATTASAQKLAADAINAVQASRADLGLLLAVEANRLDPSATTEAGLLTALVDQPTLQRELHGLDDVASVAFSHDGRMIVATSSSGEIRVWDVGTGRPLSHQPVRPKDQEVFGAAFTDGDRLLVGPAGAQAGSTLAIDVWDVASGRLLRTIQEFDGVLSATAAAAPVIVVTHSSTTDVSVVDVRTGRALAHLSTYGTWALSPDGAFVAAATPDAGPLLRPTPSVAIHEWRVDGARPVAPGCDAGYPADTNGNFVTISSGELSVSRDASTVTDIESSGAGNRVVLACSVASGNVRTTTLASPGTRPVTDESPDLQTLVSRDPDGSIRLFRTTGAPIGALLRAPLLPSGMTTVTGTVVFSPDNGLVAATADDGAVRIWSVHDTLPAITRAVPPLEHRYAGKYAITSEDQARRIAVVSPATSAGADHADVVDLRDGRVLTRVAGAFGGSVGADGRYAALLTASGIAVFDVRRGTTRTLPDSALKCTTVSGVLIAPNPDALVVGCLTPQPSTGPPGVVQRVVLASGGWRIEPAVAAQVWPADLRLSPDGRVLAAQTQTAGDSSLQLFAITTHGLRAGRTILQARSTVFTPDSKYLITDRGHLARWPTTGAAPATDLSGATADGTLSISPDGKLLASDSSGAVTIWDLPSDTELGVLTAVTTDSGAVADSEASFAPDSRGLTVSTQTSSAIGGPSTSAREWSLDPAAWERAACTIANRNLTAAEWTRYLPGVPYHRTCPGPGAAGSDGS